MEESISKSQKKRDIIALQKLGVRLIALNPAALDNLPLSSSLRQAIDDAKKIKAHKATRRQAQFIGKLMRSEDHEAIIEALGMPAFQISRNSIRTGNAHSF